MLLRRKAQGTTLEDVFHKDISTPLWSAKPIEYDPEVMIAAHLAFLRAGANIILTSTYVRPPRSQREGSTDTQWLPSKISMRIQHLRAFGVLARRRTTHHAQVGQTCHGSKTSLSRGALKHDGFVARPSFRHDRTVPGTLRFHALSCSGV